MSDLIDTTEMYLKTVYELEEDGVTPLRARIVERLDHSGPTVSQTVARMERDGLIHVAPDRSLELTEAGRHRATEVVRKHRLAERLLLYVIRLDRNLVHQEACRWEHVMSDDVEARLLAVLDDPGVDPFGNPIPEAGEQRPAPAADEMSVEEARRRGVQRGVIKRLGEPVQAREEVFTEINKAGIAPGVSVNISTDAHGVIVTTDAGARIFLTDAIARHAFIFRG